MWRIFRDRHQVGLRELREEICDHAGNRDRLIASQVSRTLERYVIPSRLDRNCWGLSTPERRYAQAIYSSHHVSYYHHGYYHRPPRHSWCGGHLIKYAYIQKNFSRLRLAYSSEVSFPSDSVLLVSSQSDSMYKLAHSRILRSDSSFGFFVRILRSDSSLENLWEWWHELLSH